MATILASPDPALDCRSLDTFFPSTTHEEATARLLFLIEQRKQLGLLSGAPGSGRSLTLRQVANEVRDAQTILVKPQNWSHNELLWNLADSLQTRPLAGEAPRVSWQRIVDQVIQNKYLMRSTVVLCDDAHLVEFSALEIWSKWTQATSVRTGDDSNLSIVLALPESHVPWLGHDLLERVDLRVNLLPWEHSDVEAYVERLQRLVSNSIPKFEPQAIVRICERSGGLARRVVKLVSGASRLCLTENSSIVGQSLVDRVAL